MELTPEQLQAAESMPLDELRALALKEAVEAVAAPVIAPKATVTEKTAEAATEEEVIDNSGEEDPEEDAASDRTIYRKEIDNGNGSVDVYEAESLEELVEKLALGKLNANKQLQKIVAERKAERATQTQVSADDEYVMAERMKKNPKQTMKEVVAEVIEERQTKERDWNNVQTNFVATHPDYFACPDNGNRIALEAQRLGLSNTAEGLEKAYRSLKASGLLVQRPEEADGPAKSTPTATVQTGQAEASASQVRSSRKGSTLSTRSGSRTTVVPSAEPTEDELYKMPLEKLRELSNQQLAKQHRGE